MKNDHDDRLRPQSPTNQRTTTASDVSRRKRTREGQNHVVRIRRERFRKDIVRPVRYLAQSHLQHHRRSDRGRDRRRRLLPFRDNILELLPIFLPILILRPTRGTDRRMTSQRMHRGVVTPPSNSSCNDRIQFDRLDPPIVQRLLLPARLPIHPLPPCSESPIVSSSRVEHRHRLLPPVDTNILPIPSLLESTPLPPHHRHTDHVRRSSKLETLAIRIKPSQRNRLDSSSCAISRRRRIPRPLPSPLRIHRYPLRIPALPLRRVKSSIPPIRLLTIPCPTLPVDRPTILRRLRSSLQYRRYSSLSIRRPRRRILSRRLSRPIRIPSTLRSPRRCRTLGWTTCRRRSLRRQISTSRIKIRCRWEWA